MKIPKTLKIGGHNYKIIFPYTFTERNDITGQADHQNKTIRVVSEVDGEKRSESTIVVTLIHEILHGIDSCTGQGMFRGDGGEGKIEALSEGIYQVLVDNGFLK